MNKIKVIKYSGITLLAVIIIASLFYSEERDLGQGFKYFEDPSMIHYWKYGDTLSFDIPPTVISYKNSRNGLVIKQRPTKYDYAILGKQDYPNGRDTTYYWFIDKCTKEVTGPILYPEMENVLQGTSFAEMLQDLNEQ